MKHNIHFFLLFVVYIKSDTMQLFRLTFIPYMY